MSRLRKTALNFSVEVTAHYPLYLYNSLSALLSLNFALYLDYPLEYFHDTSQLCAGGQGYW